MKILEDEGSYDQSFAHMKSVEARERWVFFFSCCEAILRTENTKQVSDQYLNTKLKCFLND